MGKFGDFFSMTRHERVGTVAVIVLLAVALLVAVGVRSCGYNEAPAPQTIEAARQFAAEADTAAVLSKSKGKKAKKKGKRHRSRCDSTGGKRKGGSTKRPVADRPLTPVPSF